jgi:hypothetical protein
LAVAGIIIGLCVIGVALSIIVGLGIFSSTITAGGAAGLSFR